MLFKFIFLALSAATAVNTSPVVLRSHAMITSSPSPCIHDCYLAATSLVESVLSVSTPMAQTTSAPSILSLMKSFHNALKIKRDTTYTVVSGDTGTKIAEKLGITFSALEAANPSVDWNDLQIGEVLQVPGTAATYTVVAGDTGDGIAAKLGVTFAELEAANPNVNWSDLQIGQVLQVPGGSTAPATTTTPTSTTTSSVTTVVSDPSGEPSVTSTAYVTSSIAVTSVNDNDGVGSLPDTYNFYQGDGSSGDGWPLSSSWESFSDMWSANSAVIGTNCADSVTPNTADESSEILDAIEAIAGDSGVDHRFILAIIMQESNGCVRVPTTNGGVVNPGLMQDHDGSGTCNSDGDVQDPCPESEIFQMVEDGTMGTAAGDGLVQTLDEAVSDGGATSGQAYYMAARIYNSGSVDSSGDLGAGVATHCYASDIANRLMGWVTAASTCTLDG